MQPADLGTCGLTRPVGSGRFAWLTPAAPCSLPNLTVLDVGVCPYLWLFPTTGTCSGHAYVLVFVFGHLRHHGLDSDFLVLDSGVVGLALLALGCIVIETQSLHGLEAQSSARVPLRCHTCSQSHHPALLTQD
jgi:hypothetical protein